jgi:Protein of unknown function (DUF1524)
MRSARGVLCGLVLGGLVLAQVGCRPIEDGPTTAAPGSSRSATLAQLDALAVGAWATTSGYSRDRFPHWSAQVDGCDTRDVVLQRSGEGVVTSPDCTITQGTWFSPYDGKTATSPKEIDIDHMVPLANAWRTGAKTWTDEQRGQFANDLTRPELVAVTSTTNRAKGDQDPAHWKPPRRDYWCEYAQRWVSVKSYWKLSVTAEEKAALIDMVGTCP